MSYLKKMLSRSDGGASDRLSKVYIQIVNKLKFRYSLPKSIPGLSPHLDRPPQVEKHALAANVNSHGVFLNVGGGSSFCHSGWENLDSAKGELNLEPFVFGPEARFPYDESSFDLVYTSHTLEHLSDPTVHKTLSEARRVIKFGAPLLVKIPDFDRLLDCYRSRDSDFFRDELWNFPAITPSFVSKGVSDSLATRAAYIFCGFWNSIYGDLFGSYNAHREGAYNGPVALNEAELDSLLSHGTPHAIATRMVDLVKLMENDYIFNHQNAWSKEEFIRVLACSQFHLITADKDAIVERFKFVPGIREMFDISAYYLAV